MKRRFVSILLIFCALFMVLTIHAQQPNSPDDPCLPAGVKVKSTSKGFGKLCALTGVCVEPTTVLPPCHVPPPPPPPPSPIVATKWALGAVGLSIDGVAVNSDGTLMAYVGRRPSPSGGEETAVFTSKGVVIASSGEVIDGKLVILRVLKDGLSLLPGTGQVLYRAEYANDLAEVMAGKPRHVGLFLDRKLGQLFT